MDKRASWTFEVTPDFENVGQWRLNIIKEGRTVGGLGDFDTQREAENAGADFMNLVEEWRAAAH